jgi:hypothetical protein
MMRGSIAGLVLALTLPASLAAQTVSAGATWERYSFGTPEALDIESLTLVSAPFAASVQAGRNVVFRLTGGVARATLTFEDGSEATISGLTDTELSARFQTAGGRLALTAVALLPTGLESLSFDELFVAGAIASDLLPFAVREWGTGGAAGGSIALAQPIGSFATGVSVGYVVAREYDPLSAEDFAYRPGNQLHVRAAIDRTIGRSAKLALRADWRTYSEDEDDGRGIFQAGDRFQLTGSYDYAIGRSAAITWVGWLKRGEGEYISQPDVLPSQDLLFAGAGVRAGVGSSVLVPSVELRVLSSDGADRRGHTVGFGTTLETSVSGVMIAPEARFRFGQVRTRDDTKSGFTGLDVGMTIRFGGTAR